MTDPIACTLFFGLNSGPKLISISGSILSSNYLSHSYAVYHDSLVSLNTYTIFLVHFCTALLKHVSYVPFPVNTKQILPHF
jgi:hypothetical protein